MVTTSWKNAEKSEGLTAYAIGVILVAGEKP